MAIRRSVIIAISRSTAGRLAGTRSPTSLRRRWCAVAPCAAIERTTSQPGEDAVDRRAVIADDESALHAVVAQCGHADSVASDVIVATAEPLVDNMIERSSSTSVLVRAARSPN
jgi:hypothetical protein